MQTDYGRDQPGQSYLVPPSLSDWLAEGHLAYFISEVVNELDLSGFYAHHEQADPRGNQPFDPAMMLKVLLYAYASGTFSSRKIAKKLEEDVAFPELAAGHFPEHRTIFDFRKDNLAAFITLFKQVVQIAQSSGIVHIGRIPLDVAKLQATATPHKAMSDD